LYGCINVTSYSDNVIRVSNILNLTFLKGLPILVPNFYRCRLFLQINKAVMSLVDLYFPPSTGVSIIAEHGSFFVSSAFTLAVNVISKEAVARAHGQLHMFRLCSVLINIKPYVFMTV